jgi:NAD(P)H-dependent FMN reductase
LWFLKRPGELARSKDYDNLMVMIRIISGTNRPQSNTGKVSRQVAEIYSRLNVATELIDLCDLPGEIFSPSAYAQKPQSFEWYANAVKTADGLVVVVPEYNGSFPGILKYFIDMLEFPQSLVGKPACFVGLAAGMWGALRAVEHLQDIFTYRNAFIFPRSVFIPNVYSVIDSSGRLTNSEILERLKNQAVYFIDFVGRLKKI